MSDTQPSKPSHRSVKTTKTPVVRKTDTDVKSAGPVQPKIVYRENMEMDHHLFKGTVAQCLKGDKWGPIKVKSIEHVHFFHTINSNGAKQDYTNMVSGHVHKVEWYVDTATGDLRAQCGPPLKKVQRVKGGVTRSFYEPIKIKDEDTGDVLPDMHHHQMVYMGSDKITPARIQAIQQRNAAVLGAPQQNAVQVHTDVTTVDGYQAADADPNSRG